MYLVELKADDIIIRKYVPDNNALERLIEVELPNYEYIKILENIKDGILKQSQNKNNDLPRKR